MLLLLLPLLLSSPLASCQAPCPTSWVDGSLLGLGCLLFEGTPALSWSEAAAYCQTEHQASLLVLQTEEQLDFVRSQEVLGSHEGPKAWWTGGTDQGREGGWYWASSLATVGDFVWREGQPNGGAGQNCLELDIGLGYQGGDSGCEDKYFPVCQRI